MSDFEHRSTPLAVDQPLLIVGASARAAAESARRAGYHPMAIDLFADADLAEVAEVRISRDFPYDIPTLARAMPACDWLYVGGLENYPEVVDELAAERRLLGCSGDLLRRVRDPRSMRDELCRHGVSMPESIFDRAELRRHLGGNAAAATELAGGSAATSAGDWLVKRRRSSAGLGVAPWLDERLDPALDELFDGDRYLQRCVAGKSIGAVYLASKSRTDFLGASYQLTSPSHDGNQPFRYAGSVGPIPGDELSTLGLRDSLGKMGSVVTGVFPLSGIFSLDFILDAGSELWLLEINPRYTAGCELIERTLGKSLVGLNIAACRDEIGAESSDFALSRSSSSGKWHGKKVVYAVADVLPVSDEHTRTLLAHRGLEVKRHGWATIGDIPRAGTSIRRDDPVVTVFATADDENTVRELLTAREREARMQFGC